MIKKLILICFLVTLFNLTSYSDELIVGFTDSEENKEETSVAVLNEEFRQFRKSDEGLQDDITTNTTSISAIRDIVVQEVNLSLDTPVSITAAIPQDDTNPLYSEGELITSLTITPLLSSSNLHVKASFWGSVSGGASEGIVYITTGTGSAEAIEIRQAGSNAKSDNFYIDNLYASSSTSSITFYIVGGLVGGGDFYIGLDDLGTNLYGTAKFGSISITETKP